MYGSFSISLPGLVYMIIGVAVALNTKLPIANFGELVYFALVVVLWPLVLLNVVHIGA
jgi:hypothetical protein